MKKALGILGSILCFASCGTDGASGVGAGESEPAGQQAEALAAGAPVLFVVGSTSLTAGDAAINTHLQGLGAAVTVRAATAATTADGQGKVLIVISESVTSTDVNTKFRDSAVPVICLEPALFDDFKMAGTVQNTDYGQATGQTELELTAVSHPLATGLTVPISTTAGTFSWARPAQGAIGIGKIVGTSDHMGIFAFDSGQALTSGVAPARRVGWVASGNLATTLTKQGWQLFDAAVSWTTSGCTKTPQATACAGKSCGMVSDGCSGTYNCGTCASPTTCGGSGTPNVCGCTKIPQVTACSGKSCGTTPDGCGGTYACGTCSSPSPICVNNTCQQCASASDCPAGTFSCTNNVCACRAPSSTNLIPDGGFDTPSTLNNWTASQASWSSSDADACSASGSLTALSGSITRCVQVPVVPAGGADYTLGMRSKFDGGCLGFFFQDAACSQPVGPDFLNVPPTNSSTWASTFAHAPAPAGTRSVQVQCFSNSSLALAIDQIYLKLSSAPGTF